MKSEYKILVIAGEASADQLCSLLIQNINQKISKIQWVGVGGDQMKKQGVKTIVEAKQISVVGLTDWLGRAREVLSSFYKVKNYVRENTFDLAILVDLPDFNFRIAEVLKEKKIPTYYYIAPQIWATRQHRVEKIKKYFDKVFVIFPFERDFYKSYGIETVFIGHPLLDLIERKTVYRSQPEVFQAPVIALLPGSRKSEILHHVETCREVCKNILNKNPKAKIVVPMAPTLDESLVRVQFQDIPVYLTRESSHSILRECDVAIVASGTATLETAIIGVPHCIFYKMSAFTTFYFRKIEKYKNFLGLPNILFKEEVVKEYCLENCFSQKITEEVFRMIEVESYRKKIEDKLKEVPTLLGVKGATEKAAENISNELRQLQ